MTQGAPVLSAQKQLDQILSDFILSLPRESVNAPKIIALAVSGGSDSVALLHLASQWAHVNDYQLCVFSVNHHLRPEATHEVVFTKSLALGLGHIFCPLDWYAGDDQSAIQERARKARYDMMTKKCHELGIRHLLTAHHFDDVMEWYLMRQERGNDIGLSLSYGPCFFYNDIQILRPLIQVRKQELVNFLQQNHYQWCEDSSNLDGKYQRNRIRAQIAIMNAHQQEELMYQIKQNNEKMLSMRDKLVHFLAHYVVINNFGVAIIELTQLLEQDQELQINILNYLLTVISGKTQVPRFRALVYVLAFDYKKHSLHGCIISIRKGKLYIYREYRAIEDWAIYHEDLSAAWDNRFKIPLLPGDEYKITKLNKDDYYALKKQLSFTDMKEYVENMPLEIILTLPVIRHLEKVIAIPHINYYDKTSIIKNIKIVFQPRFISRFTHF